jgi:hypothetical protein
MISKTACSKSIIVSALMVVDYYLSICLFAVTSVAELAEERLVAYGSARGETVKQGLATLNVTLCMRK